MNRLVKYEGETKAGHVSLGPNDLEPRNLIPVLRKIQKVRAEQDNEYGDLDIRIPADTSEQKIDDFVSSSYGKAILNS